MKNYKKEIPIKLNDTPAAQYIRRAGVGSRLSALRKNKNRVS